MDLKHTDELCAAVKAGDPDRAKRAIEAGDSIFSGRVWGVEKPPIVWAAMTGNSECLRVLLDAGADVDARGDMGDTALMWVVSKGRRDCIAVLLDAGADVNASDMAGLTVAMWAARYGANKEASLIGILVGAGADLRPTDSMRRTAATHAKIGGAREMAALIKGHIAAMDERKKLAKTLRAKPDQAKPQSMRM